MTRAIRAEFRKFFTTRMWWGMAVAVFLCGAVVAVGFAFLFTTGGMEDATGPGGEPMPLPSAEQIANSVYTGGITIGYLLLLTIGIIQIGAEYRHKTITSTFLADPHRVRVMLAKVVALLGIGIFYGVISLLGSVVPGALVLSLRDADPFPSSEILRTLALSLLVLGLWALIGLGVGILIPNQVAALLIGVGVAWIVEPILGLILGIWEIGKDIAQFLPSQATTAVVGVQSTPGQPQLSWWAAALVLAAYAAVLAGFGSWRVAKQDVG